MYQGQLTNKSDLFKETNWAGAGAKVVEHQDLCSTCRVRIGSETNVINRSFSEVLCSATSTSLSLSNRANLSPHSISSTLRSSIKSSSPRVSNSRCVSTRYKSM